MKKLIALLFLTLISCNAGPLRVPTIDSIVKVTYFNSETDEGAICTGIVVGLTRVLTAEHCISKTEAMYVDDHPAKVIKTQGDVVLLDTNEVIPGKRPIELAKSSPNQGEAVASLGYAYGGPLLIYVRNVAGYVEDFLIMDGPISGGMSGGPVINQKGELVGLNQGTSVVLSQACPIEELIKIIK